MSSTDEKVELETNQKFKKPEGILESVLKVLGSTDGRVTNSDFLLYFDAFCTWAALFVEASVLESVSLIKVQQAKKLKISNRYFVEMIQLEFACVAHRHSALIGFINLEFTLNSKVLRKLLQWLFELVFFEKSEKSDRLDARPN